MLDDTVVARATPLGRGALGVVRLSGPRARAVVARLCPGGPDWRPRRASLRQALDEDGLIDDVLVTWMPGPRSATGEDVVELGCHGSPVVLDALVARCVALGARPARPGEFSRRAFVNGRLDLLGAEALAAVFAARTRSGLDLAWRAREASAVVVGLRDRLLDLGAELEARLDHPGEGLGEADDADVVDALRDLATEASRLCDTAPAVARRIEGATIALVGPVNAGKSSLFNALVGATRALVSPVPGTTRDAVERTVELSGVPVTLVDTAGLRDTPGDLEAAGIALGRALADAADLRLAVFDARTPCPVVEADTWPVATHTDLAPAPAGCAHAVSSVTGAGVAELRDALAEHVAGVDPAGAAVLASQRQADLLRTVATAATEAADCLASGPGAVVAAELVTHALEQLAQLTGDDVREAVLDRLFSRFCVGK